MRSRTQALLKARKKTPVFDAIGAARETLVLFDNECQMSAPAYGPSAFGHLEEMVHRMSTEPFSARKSATWLGYIQGVYVALAPDKLAALTAVKRINKKANGAASL